MPNDFISIWISIFYELTIKVKIYILIYTEGSVEAFYNAACGWKINEQIL